MKSGFAGKAFFVMAFRRPALCSFEPVFEDIERAREARSRIHLKCVALVPIMRMNLRAEMGRRSRSETHRLLVPGAT